MNNRYEVRGDITAIFLDRKNGDVLETLIDTADLELVQSFTAKWYASWHRDIDSFYVLGDKGGDANRSRFVLHRWITGVKGKLKVDHWDHNTLNNRRSNLRVVPDWVNMQNRKGPQKNSSSGIAGAYRISNSSRWFSTIQFDKKRQHLGCFATKEEAGEAYRRKKIEVMGAIYSPEIFTSN